MKFRSKIATFLIFIFASLLISTQCTKELDINSRDQMSRTSLHNSAATGLNDLITNLIKRGASPNTTDIYGSTPLHEAVYHGHKETVKLLLDHGANVNLLRPDGTSPLHLARERKDQEIADLLLEKGAEDVPKIFPELNGDYLGQKKPGRRGVLFAPGIISKAESRDSLAGFFENSKLFIFYQYPMDFKGKWTQWPHFLMKRVGAKWEAPYQSQSVGKPWFFDLESVPEGERMIFAWRKNLDGSGSPDELYLWSSIKTSDGWTDPIRFEAPINQGFDTWPSWSLDKTLYFHSKRADGLGKSDICMSILEDGEYRSVKNMGTLINTEYTEHDPYVAPDGSYLLFSSYKPGGYGEDDIYISFRNNDETWGIPINLGETINSEYSENRVYVTPDGKFLFYTSMRTGNLDIYWADAGIIQDLKPDVLK
ncbi:ankyrin repeat domain-containing protein [Acidobacteriota bacterium]